METLGHENNAGGIAVDAVEADGGIAGGVAQEVNTLVGVGENTTCKRSSGCHCQHRTGQNDSNFVHILKTS